MSVNPAPDFTGSATEQDFRIVARLLYPEVPEDAVADQLRDQRIKDTAFDLIEALQEVEEFLENQADYGTDTGPNEAMRLLTVVQDALGKAGVRS